MKAVGIGRPPADQHFPRGHGFRSSGHIDGAGADPDAAAQGREDRRPGPLQQLAGERGAGAHVGASLGVKAHQPGVQERRATVAEHRHRRPSGPASSGSPRRAQRPTSSGSGTVVDGKGESGGFSVIECLRERREIDAGLLEVLPAPRRVFVVAEAKAVYATLLVELTADGPGGVLDGAPRLPRLRQAGAHPALRERATGAQKAGEVGEIGVEPLDAPVPCRVGPGGRFIDRADHLKQDEPPRRGDVHAGDLREGGGASGDGQARERTARAW